MRATAAIASRTGYTTRSSTTRSIDSSSAHARVAVERLSRDELGSLEALDGFVARPGRPDAARIAASPRAASSRATRRSASRSCRCSSRSAPSARVLVKDRDDGLVAAFFANARRRAPRTRAPRAARPGAAAMRWQRRCTWRRPTSSSPSAATKRCARSARSCEPRARASSPFGHRAERRLRRARSAAERSVRARMRAGAARDLVLYEGEGCLSLHALFVERGGADRRPRTSRACSLARSRRAAVEFPPGRRDAIRAALAYRTARSRFAQHAAAAASSPTRRIHRSSLDPPADEPPPLSAARARRCYAVDAPGEALAYLAPTRAPARSLCGSPAKRADVLDVALRSGAPRIARFGDLQPPPLAGNHGGHGRIADFVRRSIDDG